MPEILQYASPILYSEPTHKECTIDLSESFSLTSSKYNIHIFLSVPEIESNNHIPAVNVEAWDGVNLIGKSYKTLKKHQSFSSLFKRFVFEIGVLLSLYSDNQDLKLTIPASFTEQSQIIRFKIFPPELSIEAIQVQFEVKLTGVLYYIHEYFTTTCVIACVWIMALEILFLSRIKTKEE